MSCSSVCFTAMQDSYSIKVLAERIGAEIRGDVERVVRGVNSLENADETQLSYSVGGRYRKFLAATKAGAVIVSSEVVEDCPSSTTILVVKNPEYAFAKIAELFAYRQPVIPGSHPSAVVGEDCEIDKTASVGAHCVLGDRVKVGANTVIGPGTVIEDDVSIGDDCRVHARVTVCHHVTLGNRVILYSGAVIGSDGFGLVQEGGQWHKIPQLGSVEIADDVEVGANTCVDRGALENTRIDTGSKIDNLVQIAHNVQVGAHTVIAGTTGIAGSAKIGRYCLIGGGSSVNGHVTLCDQVIVTGTGMVTKSIDKPGVYSSGTSIQSNIQWRKSVYHFQQLDSIVKMVRRLKKQMETVTDGGD